MNFTWGGQRDSVSSYTISVGRSSGARAVRGRPCTTTLAGTGVSNSNLTNHTNGLHTIVLLT